MAGMEGMESFVAAVEEEAAGWREFDRDTKEMERVARRLPVRAAALAMLSTFEQLHELSDRLAPALGVDLIALDIANTEITFQIGEIDSKDYFHLLNDVASFQSLWRIFEYSKREDATPEGRIKAVLKERAGYPSRHAFAIHVLRHDAVRSGRADLVPDTMLAESLTALVFARTKLAGGERDAVGLRERLARAGGEGSEKPGKRFVHELAGEVEPLFFELGEKRLDPELRDLTNEARRRVRRMGASEDAVSEDRLVSWSALEEAAEGGEERPAGLYSYLKATKEKDEDSGLVAEWATDKLARLLAKANLSAQQWEALEAAFRLGGNKEAAEELGRSPNQVGVEKAKALEKLHHAAGP